MPYLYTHTRIKREEREKREARRKKDKRERETTKQEGLDKYRERKRESQSVCVCEGGENKRMVN